MANLVQLVLTGYSLWHLEDRIRAGAGWLKLDITNDESKTELDNVTYCIRSAAYQMTKKPE